MRTAAEFDLFYAKPDPWRISHANFRDKVLRRVVSQFVAGKCVIELGCGEGHLTQAVFSSARSITGIDISEVAIQRAEAAQIPNAKFEASDFLNVSFEGYDIIAAIECLYYLSAEDQLAFFDKASREHSGKLLILSAPIIGKNEYRKYFTHQELMETFAKNKMSVLECHNLNVYRHGVLANIAAILVSVRPRTS